MCGIAGFVGFEDKDLLNRMCGSVAHRGPDDKGSYSDSDVSLGHARLSIIDLSERARQPMSNEDGSVRLVFNGEIYNFKGLQKDLQKHGHKFKSNSDTEVIVHAYEQYGIDCVKKFNGMFAFVIWDSKKKALYMARDRLGEKPLYYFQEKDRLIFASEIKAILEAGVKRKVDVDALNQYLGFGYVLPPRTMFQSIKKLAAGQYALFSNGRLTVRTYWDVTDFSDLRESESYFTENIRSLLDSSVEMRLMSDRPIGLFLSGGTDSSAVLGMMHDHVRGRIKTYSIGFQLEYESTERFNEDFNIAHVTAEHFGTDHHELLISSGDAIDHLQDIVYHLDEPISNATQLSQYLLANFAKKKVAVVLGGDGGDELFCGYPRYARNLLISRYQKIPKPLRAGLVEPVVGAIRPSLRPKFEKLETPPDIKRFVALHSDERKAAAVVKKRIFDWSKSEEAFDSYLQRPKADLTKRLMYTDLKTKLSENFLMSVDKMTMASGLEYRCPFLDNRLVEFAYRIPIKMQLKGGTKHLLKKAVSDIVPQAPLRGKRYFFSPASKWMREERFKELMQTYLSRSSLDSVGYFETSKVLRLVERHISKEEYNREMIWSLLIFQMWYDRFIEKIV